MTRSIQIVVVAIGFLLGIVAAEQFSFALNGWIVVWALCAAVAIYYLRKAKLAYVLILLLALVAGGVRQAHFVASQPSSTINKLHYHKVVVSGQVVGEPYWDSKKNYVFFMDNLVVEGKPVAGELRVKSLVGNAREGYRVAVQGKVLPSLGRASSAVSYARVTILSTQQPWLTQVKTEFSKGVRRALPEPSASFMLGIMIGARSTLPKQIQDLLAAVGLSHITAVSGYNLTIIIVAMARVFGKKWQWGGLVASLWLIIGFVVLTGASASIVRAGIMSSAFLLARYYGRKLDMLACLGIGVLVTLSWSPSYLHDLGWQLSFLALTGIILLTPVFIAVIPKRFGVLGEVVAVSLAAQLATLPLIAFTFGTVALVSPLANALILPLVPPLMLLGFVLGILGMLVPGGVAVLASPVTLLVNGLIDFIRYLATLPHATIANSAPSLPLLISFYSILLVLVGFGRRSLGEVPTTAIITGIGDSKPV